MIGPKTSVLLSVLAITMIALVVGYMPKPSTRDASTRNPISYADFCRISFSEGEVSSLDNEGSFVAPFLGGTDTAPKRINDAFEAIADRHPWRIRAAGCPERPPASRMEGSQWAIVDVPVPSLTSFHILAGGHNLPAIGFVQNFDHREALRSEF